MFTNIRSIIPKRDDLCSVIDACDADIVCLTETWLSAKIDSCELLTCKKRYNIYRCDRGSRCGGGVLVAVADTVMSFPIHFVSALELVLVEIRTCSRKLIVGVCYRPPSTSPTFVNDLHDVIHMITVRYPSSPFILLGDFNFPNIVWSNVSSYCEPFSSECDMFLNLCSDFNLSQLVTQATRISPTASNILDLVLTTSPDFFQPISYLPGLSDHLLLHFALTCAVPHQRNHSKYIHDYKNADFDAINLELSVFLDHYLLSFHDRCVNANWSLFKEKVAALTEKYVPRLVITSNRQSPWFTKSLKRLCNKKKRMFRSAKLTGSQERWTAYQPRPLNIKVH